jgi:hypothetical protein
MQQNDRIELIKAAVELAKVFSANKVNNFEAVIASFELFYEYLQLKLEVANGAESS